MKLKTIQFTESLDSPYPYKWKGKNKHGAFAYCTDKTGKKIVIRLEKYPGKNAIELWLEQIE